MDYTESVTLVLEDFALLSIFRRLPLEDLLNAEQVCERWENVVKTRFATLRTFNIMSVPKSEALNLMRRCGPNLRRFVYSGKFQVGQHVNLMKEIADRFRNLKSIDLIDLRLEDNVLRVLSARCRRLKSVKINAMTLTDNGLGLLLANLPELSSLTIIVTESGTFGNCFTKLGPNLEHLKIELYAQIRKEGYSHILSRSRNLKTFLSSQGFDCDDSVFSSFCQGNITLRRFTVEYSTVIPNETLQHISHCSMLERLRIFYVQHVDSNTLIKISEGCKNLKRLELASLPLVCDLGVKSFATCKQLTTVVVYKNDLVTDESLLALAEVGILKRLVVYSCCKITDRGCCAVLNRCPQLEQLDVSWNYEVSNLTVDMAVKALRSRGNDIPLRLIVKGTNVDTSKGDFIHPLLKVIDESKRTPKPSRMKLMGCRAVLAQCPRLEELDAFGSHLVSDATVDAAIEAVKRSDNGVELRLIDIKTTGNRFKGAIDHPLLKLITRVGSRVEPEIENDLTII